MQEQLARADAEAQLRAESAMSQRATTLEMQRLTQENVALAERLQQMEIDVQVGLTHQWHTAHTYTLGRTQQVVDMTRQPHTDPFVSVYFSPNAESGFSFKR